MKMCYGQNGFYVNYLDKNYSIEFGQLTTTDLSYSGLNIDTINLINKD